MIREGFKVGFCPREPYPPFGANHRDRRFAARLVPGRDIQNSEYECNSTGRLHNCQRLSTQAPSASLQRMRKRTVMGVNLESWQKKALERLSEQDERPLSWHIRQALTAYLKSYGVKEPKRS